MTSNVSLLTCNSPLGSVRKVSDPKWHKALRLSGLGVGGSGISWKPSHEPEDHFSLVPANSVCGLGQLLSFSGQPCFVIK